MGKKAKKNVVAPPHFVDTYQFVEVPRLAEVAGSAEEKSSLFALLKANNMAALYKKTCEWLKLPRDSSVFSTMDSGYVAQKTTIEEKMAADLKKDESASEHAPLMELLRLAVQCCDRPVVAAAAKAAMKKCASSAQRMDVLFLELRWGMAHLDRASVKKTIEEIEKVLATTHDWERKNKLFIYRGVYGIWSRDFQKAATDFVASLPTFAATEILPITVYAKYTVASTLVALSRKEFAEKVLETPEVLQMVPEVEGLSVLLQSLHECKYEELFSSLALNSAQLSTDPYFGPHARHWCLEMRIKAYGQILHSHRSLSLDTMAKSFGVDKIFLETEIARLVSRERLSCHIDGATGVLHTAHPDPRSKYYLELIKHGDVLLNRMQTLANSVV